MTFRILHVDDDADIREIAALSLGLDPRLAVRSSASGEDALVEATEWSPHLILCDVSMPVMDGPELLVRLRQSPRTARIPVVFMTARAQAPELARFMSLGAAGVITKPFDPMDLARAVREHLRFAGLAAVGDGFRERMRADAAALVKCRAALRSDPASSGTLDEMQSSAHKLSGAAGIFGFRKVSCAAAALEDAVIDRRAGRAAPGRVDEDLGALVDCIAIALDGVELELAHDRRA
jgi:CheY-like chemotaxis protein/HPt (histidine-containing phosphotransfer) domain-containing protein